MADQVKMEFVDAGFRELLQSPGVRGEVERITYGIQERAGEGHYARVLLGRAYNADRWQGFVGCETYEAMKEQATMKNLSMAVQG